MRRVLMVAYHFPPLAGSSGIQRTLRFVKHLPEHGWEALVLTACLPAYERLSDDLVADVPRGTVVRRAFALDAARHLAIGGRFLRASSRPDRWVTWRLGAALVGRRMVREFRPAAIWSTYPIATAHMIGADLHRSSALPWVADFRDPMAQEGYPADRATRDAFLRIEHTTLSLSRYSVFTTPSAARTYRERYPHAATRVRVIENGYDEESFASPAPATTPREQGQPLVLLHSGTVYPSERDPTSLVDALALLKANGAMGRGSVRVRFRAAVHEELIARLARERGVSELIEIVPPIGYREALAEMQSVDALLVLQASNCNEQVPAKLYEYLRAGRPIVALTDPAGDTAEVLRRAGSNCIAPLDDPKAIADTLLQLLRAFRNGSPPLPLPEAVRSASRRERARELAELLDASCCA